jgi:DNA polymerase-3 subunit gamma/tau
MTKSYQVLARKYRPTNFDELVGQEVLVTTLSNAIENKKIAHAFILTGIRGVGKTTTARIIAKALNCLGIDGKAEFAGKPCGVCDNCVAIAASRHQDVIEIDAASRTGVDDIRAIIESINYAPAIGRFKVYIIDEVHMLSNNAFNALLKTLEEPPSHTKFIFATTEIRKVPITVLSRCQRFDLRRLSNEELAKHLANILKQENFEAEDQALALIALAADGSVRDSLSILDRALSHNNYQKNLSAAAVAEIIGLSDKNKILDLFAALLEGDADKAIEYFTKFYENSVDIISLLQDLLDINHKITLAKTIKDYKISNLSEAQQERVRSIVSKVSLANLVKVWQLLLKGLTELNSSANQKNVFEMLLIRICFAANLPSLEQVMSKLHKNPEINISQKSQNSEAQNNVDTDMVGEIMRNFADAKIVS